MCFLAHETQYSLLISVSVLLKILALIYVITIFIRGLFSCYLLLMWETVEDILDYTLSLNPTMYVYNSKNINIYT